MPHDPRHLAETFAPIFAQKIDDEWRAADQLAPIDFAGSLKDLRFNVKKLFDLPHDAIIPGPKVYYAVSESGTHCFIVYAVYHPFDWWKRKSPRTLYDLIRDRVDEHAHDMEGALFVVRKEPSLILDAIVTVSHLNFYLYTEPRRPTAVGFSRSVSRRAARVARFNETVDGNIWLDKATGRAKLYIQAKGHGIRGDHKSWGGGDRVWYYRPTRGEGDPGELNDQTTRRVNYKLEDIFVEGGLWDHRFDTDAFIQRKSGQWGFTCLSKLVSGSRKASSANPPWSWNDHDDPSPIGEMATDPARFISRYAQGWGPVSLQYVANPFLAIG